MFWNIGRAWRARKILSDGFISGCIPSEVNFVRPGSDLICGKNVCAAMGIIFATPRFVFPKDSIVCAQRRNRSARVAFQVNRNSLEMMRMTSGMRCGKCFFDGYMR